MNALDLLAQEHARIAHLLRQLAHAPEERRREHFVELRRTLETHARLELELLYPTLARLPMLRGLVREASEEHGRVSALLEALDGADPESAVWTGRLNRLHDAVERHVGAEEDSLFLWVRRTCSERELDRLGEQLCELRRWLGWGEHVVG